MFLASFPAGPWQTNCYVLATGTGRECVIIDPGFEAAAGVRELITEHALHPIAMMLTHGHLDHMFSVTPLCREYASACSIHPADRSLLSDPWLAMSPGTQQLVEQLTGRTAAFVEPDEVGELTDQMTVELAGLSLLVLHAPGHTPGSVMFQSLQADGDHDGLVFTGDVLFAGSIGRTDLPGGDHAAMLDSLRTKVLPLPDDAAVLSGHGPETTMARERTRNPYLQADVLG